ncbi:MAG TPA: NADH-quinone oxidoreductase subunit N [Isosphaeraceae bacterium]
MNPTALDVVQQTLLVLLPEALILLAAIAMMTAGAFVHLPRRSWARMAAGTLVVALLVLILTRGRETVPYAAVALNDALAYYARLIFLLTGLVLLGLAHDQVDDARAAEFFGALLMVHAGAMLVATANELVFLFAGLELVSIPTYVLLYLSHRTASTREAATKYFFLSIFSSALLLFGLAYLYGLTGVSNLKALAFLLRADGPRTPEFGGGDLLTPATLPLGLVAVIFVMAGLGFRVAAVPFHFYAPDVYQGSPTVLAALLAWVPKGIGFLAILRTLAAVLCVSNDRLADRAIVVAWVIAAATLTLGNTVALLQEDLKRLLAYSSIAHAGYLMIGVAVAFHHLDDPADPGAFLGGEAIVFYLITYALMTLGAFGVLLLLGTPERPVERVDDLDGLLWTRPWPALALILCLFSLAGVPPLAGFWGKFWIFASAWTSPAPADLPSYQLLAVIGVLNAAISAYYYLRIVVKMVLSPATERLEARPAWPTTLAVGACAALSLGFGFYPRPIAQAARQAGVAAIVQPEPSPAVILTAVPPTPPR